MPRTSLLPTLLLAVAASPLAMAQSPVTLIPDRDNTLYEEGFASNGSGFRIFAGYRLSGELRRAVLRFDVAGGVPAGAVITGATLQVRLMMTRAGADTHSLHKLTADWGEGPSVGSGGEGGGATPAGNDCTWTERFLGGALWTTPGGDYVAVASGTAAIGASNGTYTYASTPGLVADVQSWLDAPATNYGWIIRGNETPGPSRTAKAFASREDAVNAPRLTITYTVPASATPFGTNCGGPTPLVLSANGLPTIGNAGFALQLTGGAAPQTATACLVARNGWPQPFVFLGCPIWVDLGTTFLSLPFQPGNVLPITIANDPGLLGQQYAMQGLAIVGGASLDASNGLLLRIGQ